MLLFTREEDPEHGGWSEDYTVHERVSYVSRGSLERALARARTAGA